MVGVKYPSSNYISARTVEKEREQETVSAMKKVVR